MSVDSSVKSGVGPQESTLHSDLEKDNLHSYTYNCRINNDIYTYILAIELLFNQQRNFITSKMLINF